MYIRHLPFLFFTSVPGCGEESASYQRDEEIHKQIYFLFVGIIEQFKRSYVKDTVHFKQKNFFRTSTLSLNPIENVWLTSGIF